MIQLPMGWIRLPKEILQYVKAKRQYRQQAVNSNEQIISFPIFFQKSQCTFDSHYTYQAAWAIRRILQSGVKQHLDISSDIRFITQLSAITKVIYFEYNAFNLKLPNLEIAQGDILNLPIGNSSIKSISCLHVIEHIGLGRYGDPIDVNGSIKALLEIVRILIPGGSLMISVPIGIPRTLFNAHRIFDPNYPPNIFSNLELSEFSVVTTSGEYFENVKPDMYAMDEYACGLYLFRKNI